MKYRDCISARDFERWAKLTEFKLLLPQVLRRLVHATIDKTALERVDFPKGDQAYRPGYDGVTKTKAGTFKIPVGITYWELGARSDTKRKLNGDYDKRIKNRGSGDFKDVTFIAVTPSSYRNKAKWMDEKNALGDWKEVRLYVSDDLEQWIEQAPSVAIWLSSRMGNVTDGVSDLSTRWTVLQKCLRQPLPASLLLIGREPTAKAFQEWLDSPPNSTLKIVSHSPQEVIDVFAAWVEQLTSEEVQASIASRCVIAETADSWKALATSGTPLILVASESLELDETLIGFARGKGHHLLIPSVNVGRGATPHRMERLIRFEFERELLESGIPQQEAHTLARQSGGSFTVFKRLYSSSDEIKHPPWGKAPVAGPLASASLVGAWLESNDADNAMAAKMVGRPYEELVTLLNQLRKEPDSPIRFSANTWDFISPLDAWTFLHHALTGDALDRFEQIANEVLSENHPAYDLPKEDRWQAAVKGKVAKFSSELRRGLAQSLAIISTQPAHDGIPTSVAIAERARRVVEKLLAGNVGWRRWASLGSDLPLLAEAAPYAFLDAVEADLRAAEPSIPQLFGQEHSGLTGRAEHTGVLWALETLAWSPEHVAKATELLAKLSEVDPGGKWANRPQASLRDIFFSWMPHTTAPLEQRLKVISGINGRHADVGWKLVLSLLPHGSESISPHSTPEWNFWAEGWNREPSTDEHERTVPKLVEIAIGLLKGAPARWCDMLRRIKFLEPEDREKVLTALDTLDASALTNDQSKAVWQTLGDELKHYRHFPEARWTPDPSTIERLKRAREKLRPQDILDLLAPVFGNRLEFEGSPDLPWEEQEKLRQKRRQSAIEELLAARGLEGVFELLGRAKDTWGVGISLAESKADEHLGEIVPRLLMSRDKKQADFAGGYAACLIAKKGTEWALTKIPDSWTPAEFAAFVGLMSFTPDTWDYVEGQSSERKLEYWTGVRAHPFRLKSEEVARAALMLLEVKRVNTTIAMLGDSTYGKNAPEPDVLLDIFEMAMKTPTAQEEKISDPHQVHAILGALHAAEGLDENRLAKIEWNLLPILDRHSVLPVALHRMLSREPSNFVDLLTLLFRDEREADKSQSDEASDSEDIDVEDSNENQARSNAWHLLHDFATIPGSDAEGKVDTDALRKWVTTARDLAITKGRLGVCDSSIGQLLASCGPAEDGSWPIAAVGEIIEEVASDRLDSGFSVGVFNRRGVTWRDPFGGGKGTRELASEWQTHSDNCKSKWPRVSGVLAAIAEGYRHQANREDEDSERMRTR